MDEKIIELMVNALKGGELKPDVYRQVKYLIEAEGFPIPEILRAVGEYIKYEMERSEFPKGGYRPQ